MKYYYPFVTYRREASISPAILQIFTKVLNNEKIQIYLNKEQAEQKAKSLLFDDDDCGVLVINDQGIVEFYTLREEYYKERIVINFENLKKYFEIIS